MTPLAVRHAAEAGVFALFRGLVRALPHRAARGLGGWLGLLFHAADRRHREVARRNLALAFPELAPAERRRIARHCFRHYGGVACDNLSVERFDPARLCRRLTLDGWHHLVEAEEPGRGLLMLTAHLGNFEMLAHPVALYRGPAEVIARPLDNRRLDRSVRRMRERFGNRTIPRRGAGRATLRALQAGARVFLLADQRVRPHEGIELPFFGHPAIVSTLAARLSLRCGAPAVPMFCHPEPGGRFRVEVLPAIAPAGRGREAVAELTRRYLAITEAAIRRRPETWLWMHDRWRQR